MDQSLKISPTNTMIILFIILALLIPVHAQFAARQAFQTSLWTDMKVGLVSYYSLGETGASNRVDSHGSNTLTATGSPTNLTGVSGNACNFDGSNDLLSASDSASLDITGAMTVSLWFYADSLAVSSDLIGKWTTTSNQRSWRLAINSAGSLTFLISSDGTGTSYNTGDPTISTGQWYHVLLVYSPSTYVRIYLNGALVTERTDSVPASIFNSTSILRLGQNQFGATYFDGAIDEVAIWNTARPELASQIYNAGSIRRIYSNF